ncbi:MAG: AAA family ATPase, partial [Planctomycetes bacterium]|nr:AAA family ATPase [Planctomycetota bacterium]
MSDPEPEELHALYARDLEREDPHEHWLIKDLWARRAVGVIGGAAKSFKSYLALDLAFSVASATPALGRFPVEDPGLALVYLAEDSLPHVRSRIEALCRHRAIDIHDLELVVITEPTLQLDTRSDQDRLRSTIARLQPRILLLDPLVRLHSGDENDSRDVSRLLGFFRDLERTFALALALVHHVSKKAQSRPGQALRGSSDFHAFGDCNAYLQRKGDHVTLTVEHRASRSPAPLTLRLVSSPTGSDA